PCSGARGTPGRPPAPPGEPAAWVPAPEPAPRTGPWGACQVANLADRQRNLCRIKDLGSGSGLPTPEKLATLAPVGSPRGWDPPRLGGPARAASVHRELPVKASATLPLRRRRTTWGSSNFIWRVADAATAALACASVWCNLSKEDR